jgi:hypothetical protein
MPVSQRPSTPPPDPAPADTATLVADGVIPPDPVASPGLPPDDTPPDGPIS